MARSKQPPVKRESSSEFFNKRTATWEDTSAEKNQTNGVVTRDPVDGAAVKVTAEVGEQKDAGVVQLVIAVAGIYASL